MNENSGVKITYSVSELTDDSESSVDYIRLVVKASKGFAGFCSHQVAALAAHAKGFTVIRVVVLTLPLTATTAVV